VYAEAFEAANYLAIRSGNQPRVAMVLGTGLGGVADTMQNTIVVPYTDIPHFPCNTVLGHEGRLAFGALHGVQVAAMQGRFHLYEGYSPQQVVLPVRALRLLGAEVLIVTNAAGGLHPSFVPGTLLLVRDSIGLPTLAGLNPLIGPNDARFGPRFPSLSDAYDPDLCRLAREVAAVAGIPLVEGIYVMVSGPSYESQAELRFLRSIGADAVGMSTVPEVIAARHMGMRVLAISCITNQALRDDTSAGSTGELLHEDVVAQANAAAPRLAAILEGVVRELST
jgi:purine-nucleoside phosphorylase